MSFSDSFEIPLTSGISILQVVFSVLGASVVFASVGSAGSVVADSHAFGASLAAVVGPVDSLFGLGAPATTLRSLAGEGKGRLNASTTGRH